MNGHDAVFAEWDGWLETIKNDVTNLSVNRHIFREVQKIVEANPRIHLASDFYEWMGSVYAHYASIGLRRQIDKDERTISLRRLLEKIKDQPEVLSRERYVALWDDPVLRKRFADGQFNEFTGPGKPHIDPAMVEEDVSQLVKKIESVKGYVDKRIAHYDRQGPTTLPTYADLNECLDFVEVLLRKYLNVFRAEMRPRILPVWQYDWKQIFRHPWIPPAEATRKGRDHEA